MLVVQDRQRLLKQSLVKGVCTIGFISCSVYIHHLVKLNVKQPFIDEIFHLRQTHTYCQGLWREWDSKITTPPGLYILGVAYGRTLEFISGVQGLCSDYNVLRSLNLLGGVVVLPLVARAMNLGSRYWSINIASQPLLFTYYYLFYTDIWSTILIMTSLMLVIKRPLWGGITTSCWLSAVVAFASLWFRQTNIIWLAFIALVFLDSRIQPRTNDLVKVAIELPKVLLSNWKLILPFIGNFVAFVVFLKINGGITFGDKENHQVNAHLVQIFYCFTFISFFTWPVWLDSRKLRRYFIFLCGGGTALVIFNAITLFGIKWIIETFTIVHPFLLADNRHFTFYIFKKILSNKRSFLVTIPIYHFSTWNIFDCLRGSRRSSSLVIVVYFVATILTLVPSPLFEPRYYIVPLVVFRFLIQPVDSSRHVLEFIWLNFINVITQLIFFNYEFTWASEPGLVQRIIW